MTIELRKPPGMTSRQEDTASRPPLGQRAFRPRNIASFLLVVLWHAPHLAQLRARVRSPGGVRPAQRLAWNKDGSTRSPALHGNHLPPRKNTDG